MIPELQQRYERATEDSNTSPRTSNNDDGERMNIDWTPSGIWWKDFLHFAGPGWLVSIAYVDPGNYQADIQAGSLSRYSLLCIIWWTSTLSLYVQILCVRLAFYGGLSLAEAQARHSISNRMRYLNWFIAEFSIVITDLPEVIGIGIACNIFFGWPYWIGVVLSLVTTMVFLMTVHFGVRYLEMIVASFVGIMGIALFVEMSQVGVETNELFRGWAFGIKDLQSDHVFAVLGVVGSVVMPHNLYLHTGACLSRSVSAEHAKEAVFWSSVEPVLPIVVAFFINMAIVCIAAESVYGSDDDVSNVGLTDFCTYFKKIAGCALWGIALLAAGQSSAITTTYTGQYVMDGYLNLQLSVRTRAILTRLVAITPCVFISVLFPHRLNQMVNVVNALLSFLLPFAFTPLVKFNCDESVMGNHASKGREKYILHFFAFLVWLVNCIGLSVTGGGFFGDWREYEAAANGGVFRRLFLLLFELSIQVFYAWWNWNCIRSSGVGHEVLQSNSAAVSTSTSTRGNLEMSATGEVSEAHFENISDTSLEGTMREII